MERENGVVIAEYCNIRIEAFDDGIEAVHRGLAGTERFCSISWDDLMRAERDFNPNRTVATSTPVGVLTPVYPAIAKAHPGVDQAAVQNALNLLKVATGILGG